jgi:hypothetical protein
LWTKQREERGFDDTEIWSLDTTFANFAIPRLQELMKVGGYPGCMTAEEWAATLQKMIDGFEKVEKWVPNYLPEDEAAIREGLEVFAKYYLHLWC